MNNMKTTRQKIKELQEAADYEGAELADTWNAITYLCTNDFISEEFEDAVLKELNRNYDLLHEEFKWVYDEDGGKELVPVEE